MSRRELARILTRLCCALSDTKDWPDHEIPLYTDVPVHDPDRAFIEAMVTWGDFQPTAPSFNPDAMATRATLADWLKRLSLQASKSLHDFGSRPLTRAEAAQHVWRALLQEHEWSPAPGNWLNPNGDDDGDGIKDYDDPLPFDKDNNNIPDHLQPPSSTKRS